MKPIKALIPVTSGNMGIRRKNLNLPIIALTPEMSEDLIVANVPGIRQAN
jgi:hypothetical protein